MEKFFQNILNGIKIWFYDKFNHITLAETVPNEIIKSLWDREIKITDLKPVSGSPEINPISSKTNKEHFLDIFYPNPEEIFVDLGTVVNGVNVKWHAVNLGAHDITDYGDFYAWGETEPKTYYDWVDPNDSSQNYKYANERPDKLTKYCPLDKPTYWDGDTDYPDNKTTLFEDDVAYTIFGAGYRMPTNDELHALTELPNKWITLYNKNCDPVTGRAFCRADNEDAIRGTLHGIDLYLYDPEYPNEWSDFGTYRIWDDFDINVFDYLTKEEVSIYITECLSNWNGYEGVVITDTMLFKDEEHTIPAIEGVDYIFGQFPEFDRSKMLFIPAGGSFNGSTHYYAGSACGLWSSSLNSDFPSTAWNLFFDSFGIWLENDYRCNGFSVRCVSTN